MQNFFFENRNTLKKYGITYPIGKEIPYSNHLLSRGNVGDIVCDDNLTLEEKVAHISSMVDQENHTLISNESMWSYFGKEKKFWLDLKKNNIVVKAIVYVRSQEEYIESRVRQRIKALDFITGVEEWGNLELNEIKDDSDRKAIEDIVESAHYLNQLNMIAECIGKENLIVRIYDRNIFKNNSIYADFLDIFGIPLTDEFIVRDETINISLDESTLKLKQLINIANRGVSVGETYNRFYVPLLDVVREKNQMFGRKSLLSEMQKAKIRSMFSEENSIMAKEYLNGGKLFEYKDTCEIEKDKSQMQEELIRDAVSLLGKLSPIQDNTESILEEVIKQLFKIHQDEDVQIEKNQLEHQASDTSQNDHSLWGIKRIFKKDRK